MEYFIIVAAALGVSLLCAVLKVLHRRRLVRELIWAQLNGKSTNAFFCHFVDCTPEQLLFPLTREQLSRIRACRDFDRTVAEVKGIRFMDGLMNDFYFTVHYDIQGTGASGSSFTIQEDGCLRVCFRNRGQDVCWIVGSRKPF